MDIKQAIIQTLIDHKIAYPEYLTSSLVTLFDKYAKIKKDGRKSVDKRKKT